MNEIPQLWYENEQGQRWIPEGLEFPDPPENFKYQWSRFAHVNDTILRINPDGPCTRIATGSCGYSGDLMLALARPSFKEKIIAFFRTGKWIKPIQVDQAILLSAVSCEGCANVLAYERGLSWGYKKNSGDHKRVGTSCELCVPKKYVNNSEKDSRKPRDIFDMSKFPKSAQEFRDELPHSKNPALVRAAKEAKERIRKLQGKV